MLQFDWMKKTISAISDSAQLVITSNPHFRELLVGNTIETGLVSQFAQELAKTILLTAKAVTTYPELMLTNALSNSQPQIQIDEIWLSGGVASAFAEARSDQI
jgi:ethanolamine utilization protein EutA (predicted chaperonin)